MRRAERYSARSLLVADIGKGTPCQKILRLVRMRDGMSCVRIAALCGEDETVVARVADDIERKLGLVRIIDGCVFRNGKG